MLLSTFNCLNFFSLQVKEVEIESKAVKDLILLESIDTLRFGCFLEHSWELVRVRFFRDLITILSSVP